MTAADTLAEAVRGALKLVDNIAMDEDEAEVNACAAATLWEAESRLRDALAVYETTKEVTPDGR